MKTAISISLVFLLTAIISWVPSIAQEPDTPEDSGTADAFETFPPLEGEVPVTDVTNDSGSVPAVEPFPPPEGEALVSDVKSDNGSSLAVTWLPGRTPEGAEVWIFSIEQGEGEEKLVESKSRPVGIERYEIIFEDLSPGEEVSVTIRAESSLRGGETLGPFTGIPKGNLFNTRRINVLVSILVFLGLVVVYVEKARRGHSLYIRRIPGLDAVEEAVGRATEMGRPILYVPGLSSMTDVATIASLNILGPIAQKAARYETRIIVPNRDPIVYTIAREVVENSFQAAGRPDLFTEDLVFFITDSQFGYAAAVDGIIVRERPATNFYLGMFWAESLVMAETGASTGAIQIAGTDSITQLPFFIVACDYTLIGEELYAASAYLSQEPVLLGTLKAQDFVKIILLVASVAGVVSAAMGSFWLFEVFGLQ